MPRENTGGRTLARMAPMSYRACCLAAVLLCAPVSAVAALCPITSNTFIMGARCLSGAAFESDEQPAHPVMLGNYLIADAEVTMTEFCMMLNQRPAWIQNAAATDDGTANACYGVIQHTQAPHVPLVWLTTMTPVITNHAGVWQPCAAARSNHPMVHVTWYGAALYCNYLSERDGLAPMYDTADWSCRWSSAADANAGYHLPTEAQWEYAISGAASEAYPWGPFLLYERANVYGSNGAADDVAAWPATMPVRSYTSNAFGLYDGIGNVREWCHDWYQHDYYSTRPGLCPKGPDGPSAQYAGGTNRVVRGGGWAYQPEPVSVSSRAGAEPATGAMDLGFRVSRYALPIPEPCAWACVAAVGAFARRRPLQSAAWFRAPGCGD